MDSVFGPEKQHQRVDSKIVVALERSNQAFRVLLWERAQQHGLSPIQIQILVFLASHDVELCRVGHLAREFGVTAATISDAVSTLATKKLIVRVGSPDDRRAINLKLSPAGKRLALKLGDWADAVRDALSALSPRDQVALLESLMKLIAALRQAGIVSVARMCISCKHFVEKPLSGPGPHFCLLLEKPLPTTNLRVDCPEHVPIY